MQPEVPFNAFLRATGAPVGPMQDYEVCLTATTEKGLQDLPDLDLECTVLATATNDLVRVSLPFRPRSSPTVSRTVRLNTSEGQGDIKAIFSHGSRFSGYLSLPASGSPEMKDRGPETRDAGLRGPHP